MELRVEDQTIIKVEKGDKAVFGRGNGFDTPDQTVSRRHVILELHNQTEPRVSFEVVGRNPVWVRAKGGEEVRVFRKWEKGEVADGDWLCVSGKRPVWLKVRNVEERDLEGLINGSDWEGVDVSGIDPVKEFGFIVMGHEFNQYPKKMKRNVKDWNWFLEEPSKESDDDDEYEGKGKRGGRRKRKKGDDDENEEWTGDAEVDEELVAKLRKVNKPKYSTRFKARREPQKKAKGGKSSDQKKTAAEGEEEEEEEGDR